MIAAVRSRTGGSAEFLRLALQGQFSLLLSVPLLLEYEAVLNRPEHRDAAHLSPQDITVLIDRILMVAEPVLLRSAPVLNEADPDDVHLLTLAVDGRATAIVTHNTRHFARAAARLGVDLYTPAQLLARLKER